MGGKGYVLCGINNGAYVSDFWRFDPLTVAWTQMRSISNATDEDFDDDYNIVRASGVALLIGDKVYISCGENGSLKADTWEYFPETDLWEVTSDFEGTTRTAAVAITTGTRAFVVTGRSSTYRFDDMWEFLPDVEYDTEY
jgi:N-acetylneuraminic acid mutarotase